MIAREAFSSRDLRFRRAWMPVRKVAMVSLTIATLGVAALGTQAAAQGPHFPAPPAIGR